MLLHEKLDHYVQHFSGAKDTDIPSSQTSSPGGVMELCVTAYAGVCVYTCMSEDVRVYLVFFTILTQIPLWSVLGQTELNLQAAQAFLVTISVPDSESVNIYTVINSPGCGLFNDTQAHILCSSA